LTRGAPGAVGAAGRRLIHAAARAASQPAPSAATAKIGRFYREVSVARSQCGAGYSVMLDKRALKSTEKRELVIPSDALAHMVAQEWDAQETHVEKQWMHLTSLCNTVVDSPISPDRTAHAAALVAYLETDTVCFLEESPADLYEMQVAEWTPLVQWFEGARGVALPTTVTLSNAVPSETIEAARQRTLEFSDWGAVGFEFAVRTAKSFVIGDALVSGHLTPEDAEAAASVETRFQVQRFGEVEWVHPLDRAETTARMAAAALFTRLCEE